jgi:hypothetical protein
LDFFLRCLDGSILRKQPRVELERLDAFQRDMFPEAFSLREKNDVSNGNDYRGDCHSERVVSARKPMQRFLQIIPCFGERPMDPKAAARSRIEQGILVSCPLSRNPYLHQSQVGRVKSFGECASLSRTGTPISVEV